MVIMFRERLQKAILEVKQSNMDNAFRLQDEILAFERSGGTLHEVDDFYLDQLICILDSFQTK